MRASGWMVLCLTALWMPGLGHAAEITFTSRELFRIPFGKNRDTLASKIEDGNFIFPRDFTRDAAGHFYIYDTNNHRIARFSAEGKYQIGYAYPATAQQVFAHADSHENLWLLISDPLQGIFYGIYDPHGKSLRSGIFSRFDQYRFHLDDASTLHVILSSKEKPSLTQTYILDEEGLIMKRESIARPPETHHQIRRNDRTFYIDQVPDGEKEDFRHVNHITDDTHRGVADIKGSVIYMTGRGEIYTRVGERDINVYDVDGSLKGKIHLTGLSSACASIRFDSDGSIYELDGIVDEKGEYTSEMTGMRLLEWQRN